MGLPSAPIVIDEYSPTLVPVPSTVVIVEAVQVGLVHAATFKSSVAPSK